MINKIKQTRAIILIALIISIMSSATTYAAMTYFANQVEYKNGKSVATALDELYANGNISKLSELKAGTNTINNNTSKTMYVALIAATTATNASDIINTRTQINSISGASSQEISYSFDSVSNVGIRLYKLTNCGNTISVESKISENGNGKIIFLGN